jgi:hypothetical protein
MNALLNKHMINSKFQQIDSGKVSKHGAPYFEEDTPTPEKLSHNHRTFLHILIFDVLIINMKEFFHYLLQGRSYEFLNI